MPRKVLRTVDIARAAGVHPNTVRLYEGWGFISAAPRSPAGYRMYSEAHREQMILARLALVFPYPGGKKVVLDMLACYRDEDFDGALAHAQNYREAIRRERAQADAAAEVLEAWVRDGTPRVQGSQMQIGEAARLLEISRDVLRSWERNGLIRADRNPHNRYRFYRAADISRLRVIRVLRQAGYSMMAVLRMILALDGGQRDGLRTVLDTPSQDEDACYITDRWISTLQEQEDRAGRIIEYIMETAERRENRSNFP